MGHYYKIKIIIKGNSTLLFLLLFSSIHLITITSTHSNVNEQLNTDANIRPHKANN